MNFVAKLGHQLIPFSTAKTGNNPTKANRFASSATLSSETELKLSNMLHITTAACHVLQNIINRHRGPGRFQRSQAKIFLMTSVSWDMLNWDSVQWQQEECEGQIVKQKFHAGNFKAKIKSSSLFFLVFTKVSLPSKCDVWENQC